MNKKTLNIIQQTIPILLCVIFAIFPIFELFALCLNLEFRIHGEIAMAVIYALLAVASAVLSLVYKLKYNRAGRILLIISAPLSLLSALCFACGEWGGSVIFAIIWVVCVFLLYIKFVPDSNFKAITAAISVLLGITVVVCYLVSVIYTAFFSSVSVESVYPSIEGNYQAELGTEESLLSTKTVVYITRTDSEASVVFGSYWKKPILVYEGEDYEYKTAQIVWLDESTVIINGEEYAVE
ncbi:MAG: hypothetical protein IKM32_00880 [Clostridia bacterium]|nr:hypothetical protein [Clostridia bacterium]